MDVKIFIDGKYVNGCRFRNENDIIQIKLVNILMYIYND